jgi:hypothetical protein
MMKPLFLIAIATALFPAHSYAAAHVFATADAEALNNFNGELIALEDDINQTATTLNQPDAYALSQVQCLLELTNALDMIDARVSETTGLVGVSAVMKHSDDEMRVNKTIARSTHFSLQRVAHARSIALQQAAICSTSAVVNTYAQKAEVIADRAANGIRYVENKVTTDSENPRQ